MGDKGQVYEKGWDGQYHPKEGLFGPEEAEVSTGTWSGEPEPATDWKGDQVRAADGTPLYRSSGGGSSGGSSWEDAAAGGLAGLVVMVALALLAAAAWIFAKVVKWWWPRMLAAARQDIAERRVSLDTVGLWLPAVGLALWGLVMALRVRTDSPAGVAVGLVVLAAFLELAAYVGLHLVESWRAREQGAATGRSVVGWGLAVAFFVWLAFSMAGTGQGMGVLLFLAILVALTTGAAWGNLGRPNWMAETRAGIAARAVPKEDVAWTGGPSSPSGQPGSTANTTAPASAAVPAIGTDPAGGTASGGTASRATALWGADATRASEPGARHDPTPARAPGPAGGDTISFLDEADRIAPTAVIPPQASAPQAPRQQDRDTVGSADDRGDRAPGSPTPTPTPSETVAFLEA